MIRIRDGQLQWISKHRRCFSKIDAVPLNIRSLFVGIPLEFHHASNLKANARIQRRAVQRVRCNAWLGGFDSVRGALGHWRPPLLAPAVWSTRGTTTGGLRHAALVRSAVGLTRRIAVGGKQTPPRRSRVGVGAVAVVQAPRQGVGMPHEWRSGEDPVRMDPALRTGRIRWQAPTPVLPAAAGSRGSRAAGAPHGLDRRSAGRDRHV